MSEDAQLLLYYREGCHLCEELASLLFRGWPQLAEGMQWRDVDSHPQWAENYGLRVPVLLEGGRLVVELVADRDALQQHFGAPDNPL